MRFESATALGKHLRESSPTHFAKVYVVVCSEESDRRRVMRGIAGAIAKGCAAQVKWFYGDEGGARDGLQEIRELSLFAEQKVVVVDGIDQASTGELKGLEEYVGRPDEASYLVLGSAQARSVKGVLEGGKRSAVILDLMKEKPWERKSRKEQWVLAQARKSGKSVGSGVMEFLFQEVGEELLALEMEMGKLLTYVGERAECTMRDAQAICGGGAKQKLWKMAEDLVWEQSREAIGLVENATDLFMLFPQVRGQLQMGIKLHESGGSIASVAPGAFPKTIEKYNNGMQRLPKEYFKKGLIALFESELMAKNSSHSPVFIWEHFCCRLLQSGAYALPSSL